MSREESDREDLLREATALVERIELRPTADSNAEHVVVGFRREGAASFFFGSDPVYQFNTAGELRRAFRDGLLLKAADGRLAALTRVRLPGEVRLVRRDLTDAESVQLLGATVARLRLFQQELEAGDYKIVGQVPSDADVLGRVKEWLAAHQQFAIATAPNVEAGGKRV